MSSPRRTPITDKNEFDAEIRIRRAERNLTQGDLGAVIGVSPARMSGLLSDPDSLPVGRLRKIIKALSPDPLVLLAFLGYDQKILRQFKERSGRNGVS